jgi:hypothetical protein
MYSWKRILNFLRAPKHKILQVRILKNKKTKERRRKKR